MAEYIEKAAAVKIAERYGLSYGSVLGKHSGIADCIAEEISQLPAADVVPLKRGEWRQDEYTIRCSLCGFGMFPLFTFQDGEVAHGEFIPHYCPMCGAQMNMEVPYREPISE